MIKNELCSTTKDATSEEINSRTLNHGCSLHVIGATGQDVTAFAVGVNMLNFVLWNMALSPKVHQCFPDTHFTGGFIGWHILHLEVTH